MLTIKHHVFLAPQNTYCWLLGPKETPFPRIPKGRVQVQRGVSHDPCTFGSCTLQPLPLPSTVELFRGQRLPASSLHLLRATSLSSAHLCNITAQTHPSRLFLHVLSPTFPRKRSCCLPVFSWGSATPVAGLRSPLFPLCRLSGAFLWNVDVSRTSIIFLRQSS